MTLTIPCWFAPRAALGDPTQRVLVETGPTGAHPSRARRAPRVLIGRYQLQHRIGSSARAEVYLATDQVLEREVAIKLLRPSRARDASTVARFRDEALGLARADSPRVVAIHDVYLSGTDEHFVVMRHVVGRTLARYMVDEGLPRLSHAVRITRDLLDGLAALARHHLVARDLKPSHVMLDADERAVLLAAELVDVRRQPPRPGPDDRHDLRQVGLLLLYMLTGVTACAPGTPGLAVLLARLPRPIAHVIERALTADPAARFASAATMKDLLDRALPGSAPWVPGLAVTAADADAVPTLWLDPGATVVGQRGR